MWGATRSHLGDAPKSRECTAGGVVLGSGDDADAGICEFRKAPSALSSGQADEVDAFWWWGAARLFGELH